MSSYQFIYIPAEDDTVDAEYQMKTPTFQNTPFSVQDGRSYGAGYVVNEYFYGKDGELTAMQWHGEFRSLDAAKNKAIALYEKGRT